MRKTNKNEHLKEFRRHILNAKKEMLLATRSPIDSLIGKLEKRINDLEKPVEAKVAKR